MNFSRPTFLVSIGLSAAVAFAAGCGSSSSGGSPGSGDDGGLDATAGGSGSGGNSSSGSSSGGSSSGGGSSGSSSSGSSSSSSSGSSDAGVDGGSPDGGADSGPDASPEAGADASPEAGADAGLDAGADASRDAAADSGDAGCVSLTVKNYLTWCTLSVNGQTLVESNGPGTTSTSTVCVPPGTIDLVASPISTTFELGPDPWHDTSGDHGSGDPGTQADLDGGVHATSSTTLVATSGSACVWACCPFTDGTGCGVGNQCP